MLAPASGRAAPAVAAPVKALLWSDEFDGPAGQTPAAANWTYDVGRGTGGWGNNELEYYSSGAHNVSLDGNSNLQIVAYHETTPDNVVPSTPGDTAYTSARIKTQGLQEWSPPLKLAARMLVPWTKGLWPALWMVGDAASNPTYNFWPAEGELDIAEWVNNTFSGHLHVGQTGNLHTQFGPSGYTALRSIDPYPTRWFTYGVDWYTDRVNWHLDGQIVGTLTQAAVVAGGGDWMPFSGAWPFYVVMNLAVGGNSPGSPDGTGSFPQTMLVDWVRVYSI